MRHSFFRRCYGPIRETTPAYHPPAHERAHGYDAQRGGLDPFEGLVIFGVFVFIAAVIASAFSEDETEKEIQKATDVARRATDDARQLTQTATHTAKAIDRFIEGAASDARAAGRATHQR
jgi:hypothetical protein